MKRLFLFHKAVEKTSELLNWRFYLNIGSTCLKLRDQFFIVLCLTKKFLNYIDAFVLLNLGVKKILYVQWIST